MPTITVGEDNDRWLRSLRPQALAQLDADWDVKLDADQILTMLRTGQITIAPVQSAVSTSAGNGVLALDPLHPEDLTYTRVLRASVGGQDVTPLQWQAVVQEMHRAAFAQLKSKDALKQASVANITDGLINVGGYKPLPDVGISIQNLSSNDSWRSIIHLARKFNIPVEVEFEWYTTKPTAAHPGECGRLVWPS